MKKVLVSLAAMAMMGMMMTSCQKNEGLSKDTFTATTESNAKTHLDGLSLKWDDEGESIMVKGENGSMAEYFATSVTNNGTCATFACEVGQEVSSSEFMIYYPASMMSATATNPQLSAEQEYAENSVKGFPMYAVTQSHAFQFTNLCGLFHLQLQKTGVSVRSITITTDKAVNGTFEVGTSAEGAFQFAAYTTDNDAQKSVTLDCGVNGVSIDDLTDFNIYLPVGEYNTFDITITATDGSVCTKSLNGNSLTINRNERVTLTRQGEALEFVATVPQDVIHGLFTINTDNDKVYFSKGNLQNINGEWQFAEHQYNYLGTYSATAWDLFGWSCNHSLNNYGMSTYTSSTYYRYDLIDWGTLIGNGETWRTLSSAEWGYILGGRDNARNKRGTATVNNIHGLILLPDTWTLPAGLTFNSGANGWDNNIYSIAQWEQMETAGAVFLPAAGQRNGNMLVNSDVVYYWSSTPTSSSSHAYVVTFNEDENDYTSDNRSYRYKGSSVRLVQNYRTNR